MLSMAAADRRILRRGLAVLVFVIAAGVTVVETQMNHLTQRREFAQVLNLRRETSGYYRAYLFGQSWGVRAIYPLGTIANNGRSVTLALGGGRITVPTVLAVDIDRTVYWLEVWRRQFVSEAFKTKEELAVLLEQLRPLFRKLADEVRP